VRNTITVTPEAVVSPAQAKTQIAAALLRNAQVEADRVQVTITGNQVTLLGVVSSWAERHQAEYTAWCAPGVTHVDNRLSITS
jgi:osmotically-inducible protein OsmY